MNRPSPPKSNSRIKSILLLSIIFLPVWLMLNLAVGQENENEITPDGKQSGILFGFKDQAKVGAWTPVHFGWLEGVADKADSFSITVRDGDDSLVAYRGTLSELANNKRQGFCRFGRSFGDTSIKLFDSQGNVLLDQVLSGTDKSTTLSKSTRLMHLVFEPEDKSLIGKSILSSSIVGVGEEPPLIISTTEAHELPCHGFLYDGIDTVSIVANDAELLNSVSEQQWDALENWIENGGRLLLSVSPDAAELIAEGGCLERFCPGTYVGPGQMELSSQLEKYSESKNQLIARGGVPLPVIEIKDPEGQVELKQNQTPLIIRGAAGLGETVFLSFDLTNERLANWSGYSTLVSRVAKREGDKRNSEKATARSSRVSHYGYEDILGQLRVPLDQFSKVKFVAFTWVAVLIGLYILLIGPGDYFFLKKLVKKMELTWITFTLISLAFCGLAYWAANWTKPNEFQVNQLEIIDIDTTTGKTRGSIWANLYSPSTDRPTIELDQKNGLGFDIQSDMLSWQGLPGDGLGGMDAKTATGLVREAYINRLDTSETGLHSKLESIPLQVSSSKSLFAQWWSTTPAKAKARLKVNKFQRLDGTITNPLDVELTNCRVLFENWVYILERRLKPGETVSLKEMAEKNTKGYLTRRTRTGNKTGDKARNQPWDPTSTDVRNIANIMMFYGAAGGSDYTGLTHDYQPFVDLSQHLNLGRAILVGEVNKKFSAGTHLVIDDADTTELYDKENTVVRMIVAVEAAAKKETE